MSGTDGNNHGIYFGVNYLKGKTGKIPVVYVSDEAHYSNYRLCDVQNLDVRLVKSNDMGQMVPEELENRSTPRALRSSSMPWGLPSKERLMTRRLSRRYWTVIPKYRYIGMSMRLFSADTCHLPNIAIW